MAESHINYMHHTFPTSRNNDTGSPHLSTMHEVSHHDHMLRARSEMHSASHEHMGTVTSGHGHASMGHAMANRGGPSGGPGTMAHSGTV